jgi:hypothetical protein
VPRRAGCGGSQVLTCSAKAQWFSFSVGGAKRGVGRSCSSGGIIYLLIGGIEAAHRAERLGVHKNVLAIFRAAFNKSLKLCNLVKHECQDARSSTPPTCTCLQRPFIIDA